MSFSGQNLLTNLNYFKQQVGRTIKASKNYHLWEFNLNGIYHRIELFHSLIKGNIRVVLDGKLLGNDSMFEFDIDGTLIEIVKKSREDFILYIGERTFNEMLKEESTGKNKDLVEKKLEDLRKKNNNNNFNINKNPDIYYKNNVDINLDSDDDIWYENKNYKITNENNNSINNKNKFVNNSRDDDNFYKSNNNLDFSDKVFEKNKKILENINFFEDNDDNINNNCTNNNNFDFTNNYNKNKNSNFQYKNNDYKENNIII